MPTVPLYIFVHKNRDALLQKGFEIDPSNRTRDTFYLGMHPNQSNLAQQLTSNPWLFDEQHTSIEKNDDPSNPAMGPHVTLTYRHSKDPTLISKTHIFLNRHLQRNGCYQQRILKRGDNNIEETIFTENYSDGQRQTVTPYPGVPFSIQDLEQLSSVCIRHLLLLDAERVSKYLELYNKSQMLERSITETLHNKCTDYLEEASMQLDELKDILVELNAYTAGRKFVMDKLISAQITELKQQALEQAQTEDDVPAAETNQVADGDILNTLLLVPNITNKHQKKLAQSIQMQDEIVTNIDDILEREATLPNQQEAFYNCLITLIETMFIFEYTFSSAEAAHFSRKQRARLNPKYFDLLSLLEEKVLLCQLDAVQSLFRVIQCKYDLVPLFSKLLNHIDEWRDDAQCRKIARSIQYFYQDSEVFREFVRFKLHSIEYSLRNDQVLSATLNFNILGSLYLSKKFHAYNLYLELGCSTEGKHGRVGRTAFNALQTLLLVSTQAQHSIKPYVEALFAHGAVTTTTLHYLYGEATQLELGTAQTNTSSYQRHATLFGEHSKEHHQKANTGIIKTKINLPLGKEPICIQSLAIQTHILNFAWQSLQLINPKSIEIIANFVDLKTCLLEYTTMLSQDNFLVSYIPSTKGGAAFVEDEASVEDVAQQYGNFQDNDNISTYAMTKDSNGHGHPMLCIMIAERKTLLACVSLNPKYFNKTTGISSFDKTLLASIKTLYEKIESMMILLSDSDKRVLVKSIVREAIEHKLRNELALKQLNRYTAAITLQSLVSHMSVSDYKTMIHLFKQYGEHLNAQLGKTSIAVTQIYSNLLWLLQNGQLNPRMQRELWGEMSKLNDYIAEHKVDEKNISSCGL